MQYLKIVFTNFLVTLGFCDSFVTVNRFGEQAVYDLDAGKRLNQILRYSILCLLLCAVKISLHKFKLLTVRQFI